MMKNFFRDRRVELNLTQVQMAAILNITQAAVSTWECFSAAPSLRAAAKLADAYQVSRERMEREIVALNRQIESVSAA